MTVRPHAIRMIATLGIALALMLGGTDTARAQATETTAGHPAVGTWVLTLGNGNISLTALTSDGIVIDSEPTGEVGVDTWAATGPTTGSATFAILMHASDGETPGRVIIQAELDYQEANDALEFIYSITAMEGSGEIYFSDSGVGTAKRLTAESPEQGGTSLTDLVIPDSDATPTPS